MHGGLLMNKDDFDVAGRVVAKLTIIAYDSGAMSVGGNIENEAYALALIDGARDAVKNHHKKTRKDLNFGIVLPAHDNPLSR